MDDIVLPGIPDELKPENNPEPAQEEAIAEPTTESAEAEVVEEEANEPEIKKGEGQRIKELNQRAKAAEAKAQSLAERLAEVTNPNIGLQTPATYVPQVQPGQEITQEQYSTDVAKTAKAQVDLAIAQERAVNRINSESVDVVRTYPQLDPESDQFDKELSDAVVSATEAQVRNNPYTASVKKVVDTLMKPYMRSVQKEAGKITQQVARQANETAMRPTGVRQPEKPATEKSMAELEAELGTVVS